MNLLFILLIPVGLLVLLLPMLYWDKGRRSLVLALRSLWLHKLRSFLSVLGIIIGTGAVIALMAFGEGSMHDALEDIKRMGATNIIVRSVKPPEEGNATRQRVAVYGLMREDYESFHTLMEGGTVTRMVPMRVFPQQITYMEKNHNGRMVGTTPEYALVNQLEMAKGRFLVAADSETLDNVAVIGSSVARSLFPFEDPMGKPIRLATARTSAPFRVIGVVRDRMPTGGTGGSQAAEDFNQDVYLPLETCRARFGETVTLLQSGSFLREKVFLSQVTLTVSDIDKVRPTGDLIRNVLRQHYRPDWLVTVPLDKLEEAERTQNRYKMLLVLIASISLVVGGIGIMNIMLATVTERTREIGIRRALGAKRRDITLQFLVEAVVQTTVGGMLGAVVGLALVFVVPPLVRWGWEAHVPAKIHVPSIFLSLVVAISVGVLFGWYPARRASLLDPIEALRHE